MAEQKVIAVVGATGAQGGGLVRAILADPSRRFAARAVTRDPSSEKARELARLGAEVVAGDVDDPASLERAFRGCHGAYCVTFFWAHLSPEKEIAEARNMAQAAKAAGVRHAIWSTLEDTRKLVPLDDPRMPTLNGKYKVPHFDGKGEADRFFVESGVPTTFLLASFYWDNFIFFGAGPKPGPDGALALTFPLGNAKMAGVAAEDIGHCALGIFAKGSELAGRRVGIAGEHLTGRELAAKMTRALGREVRYHDVPPEVYRGFGFPGAEDLGNMFQFYRDFEAECNGVRSVAGSRALYPALQDFDTWLSRNASRIPLG
jgi:uncharacterized protein YbjT (DUF2867 family)